MRKKGAQAAVVITAGFGEGGDSGGVARRLTSHEGFETFPKFSPDGSQIAFSAEYNGTRQVYVMPSGGGTPKSRPRRPIQTG